MDTNNDTLTVVKNVLNKELDIDPEFVTGEKFLIDDLGLDELDIVQAILCLETELSISIPDSVIPKETELTVQKFVEIIDKQIAKSKHEAHT